MSMPRRAIAAELAPYAQQMMANIQAMGGTQQQLAAQGQQMQSNGRVQRLMQLAQEKRCDKR
jgi:hypothetical protein